MHRNPIRIGTLLKIHLLLLVIDVDHTYEAYYTIVGLIQGIMLAGTMGITSTNS